MNKNHFYEDGEPKNGIVKIMLDQISEAIAGMYVNRHTTYCDFSDDQFLTMVESVIVLMSANLGYKYSLLRCRVNEKLNPIK